MHYPSPAPGDEVTAAAAPPPPIAHHDAQAQQSGTGHRRAFRRAWRRPVIGAVLITVTACLAALSGAGPAAADSPTAGAGTAGTMHDLSASSPDHPAGSSGSPSPAQASASAEPPGSSDPAASSGTQASTSTTDAGTCLGPAPPPPPPAQVVDAGLYVNHHLTDSQAHNAQEIIAVGKAMGITRRGVQVAIAAAMMESSLHAWQVSGPYVGLFQQLADPASGKYTGYDRSDPVGASRMFFQQLVQVDPGYQTDPRPDWAIAELVQQTGDGTLFAPWFALAVNLVTRYYKAVPPYEFYPKTAVLVPVPCPDDGDGGGAFDPGDIISDQVFYDSTAMSTEQVRAFIDAQDAACQGSWCLRNLRVDTPSEAADQYCDAYAGGADQDAAEVITDLAVACHVNPQVMLVTLQKESGLLTRTDVSAASYAAAWGWHCPDTGPGSSANCDPAYAGFFNQAYGMAKQWARYRVDPDKYHYQAGETADIAYNVPSSGCGSAPVHIENTATASLYNYTPYQPNAASLASYPGTGDRCSSYGNRNFYFLFSKYFGSTGGGTGVAVHGVDVTIPDSPYVPADLVGATITAPNAAVAKGIAAGLATLGTPYVWGGGTDGGPADQGCARGGGSSNSCQGIVGFDCSGLTGYVLRQAGFAIPTNSSAQRAGGTDIPWSQGLPGDIIGFPGHVAIYLGKIDSTPYLLEAPHTGAYVHVRTVYTVSDGHHADAVMHRYWS